MQYLQDTWQWGLTTENSTILRNGGKSEKCPNMHTWQFSYFPYTIMACTDTSLTKMEIGHTMCSQLFDIHQAEFYVVSSGYDTKKKLSRETYQGPPPKHIIYSEKTTKSLRNKKDYEPTEGSCYMLPIEVYGKGKGEKEKAAE